MSPAETAKLSVRGEASLTVAADYVDLSCSIMLTRPSKAEALAASAEVQRLLTADLDSMGGLPFTVENKDAPLTWSWHSANTWRERGPDLEPRQPHEVDRVVSSVSVSVVLRDLRRLEALGVALGAQEDVDVHGVRWQVDDDNPAWGLVRAAAIHAAILKARDYASALGGSLERLDHLADAGLLGGADDRWAAQAMSSGGRRDRDADSPTLDPVPQDLTATIDARFVASVASLTPA